MQLVLLILLYLAAPPFYSPSLVDWSDVISQGNNTKVVTPGIEPGTF